ncbi:MAG: phage tail family protein [Lactimicrobium massiliense]|nr:phage tail domain-containing protein [Lactimicrobium massiliense]MDD6561363.1 phage tail family protein [Lactimicrobium massiliense]
MDRKITCTNEDNISMEFTSKFSPFLLQNCDGIYEVSNNVVTKDNTMVDGATYLGTTTKMRNIVLTLADRTNHVRNRNLLYQLFKPKSPGVFRYEEEDEIRTIDYYVESVVFTSVKTIRVATVSLLCPDPFFQDLEDMVVQMSGWQKLWIFPHCFKNEKEEFGKRLKEKLKAIDNGSAADNVGITVTMTAEGPVKNPALYHVEFGEYIKIGTASKPLNLDTGDQVIITTETNKKNVYLVKDGVTTAINEYLDEGSTFIQLQSGQNSLRYEAESGEDYLNVSISFRYKYLGV